MKKRTQKPLSLNRETIRNLEAETLLLVQGGATITCTTTICTGHCTEESYAC
jgi:hypothetical protein